MRTYGQAVQQSNWVAFQFHVRHIKGAFPFLRKSKQGSQRHHTDAFQDPETADMLIISLHT
jgi:hypothetical protein